jgi:hypothetical protein
MLIGGTADQFSGPSDHGEVTGGGVTFGEVTGASAIVGATNTSLSPTVNIFSPFKNLRDRLRDGFTEAYRKMRPKVCQ